MYLTFLSARDVALGDAALYSLIGFVIVLAVLALLVGIFYLMGAIFRSKLFNMPKKEKKKGKKKADEPAASEQPATLESAAEDEGEVIAAITAAISIMLEQEGEPAEFVIRRVTRKK